MSDLVVDLRQAFKVLLRRPAFLALSVATLLLGIGATTAIFSVVYAVLLKPLPYEEPDRLVIVWPEQQFSKADFAEFSDQSELYRHLAAYSDWSFTLTGLDEPLKLQGARATARFFDVFGVKPLHGRSFLPEEDQPGKDKVAVLSQVLWQRLFNRDPSAVGRTLMLDGNSYLVIGVMPDDFRFPSKQTEIWVPAPLDTSNPWDFRLGRYLQVVGRLETGASPGQAAAEISTIARHLREKYPNGYPEFPDAYPENYGANASVVSLHERIVGDTRAPLLILFAATGLVLLIACANVSNLQIARMRSRQKEIAIRTSLGATRSRVIRQILCESVVLSLIGGAVGLAVVYPVLHLLGRFAPASARLDAVELNVWVLGFTLLVTVLAGFAFGLASGWRASRVDLQTPLKEGGRSSVAEPGRHNVQKILVIAEVALAMLLVVSSGLLIKSLWLLTRVNPGFETAKLVKFEVAPPFSFRESHRLRAYYRDVLERLTALPAVKSAGVIQASPLSGENWHSGLKIDGRPAATGAASPEVDWRTVSPGYFQTLGIPLIKGRVFETADHEDAPRVAVINETMARRLWPDEDPIGERVSTDFERDWATIIGVVGDVKHHGLGTEPKPELYRPYAQIPRSATMTIFVRTTTPDPLQPIAEIRHAVWAIDANVPISKVDTLERVVASSTSTPRFNTILLGIFAAIALVLGIIGVYGLISYLVGQRGHEFSVRLAMGATPRELRSLVLGQGIKLAGVGLLIGVVAAFLATRALQAMLYGVTGTDLSVFATVAAVMVLVSLLASYFPAQRASKTDPIIGLRYE